MANALNAVLHIRVDMRGSLLKLPIKAGKKRLDSGETGANSVRRHLQVAAAASVSCVTCCPLRIPEVMDTNKAQSGDLKKFLTVWCRRGTYHENCEYRHQIRPTPFTPFSTNPQKRRQIHRNRLLSFNIEK